MSTPAPPSTSVLTPCTGICRLDARGYCEGCLRTGAEIAHWRHLSDTERLHYMQQILPTRSVR